MSSTLYNNALTVYTSVCVFHFGFAFFVQFPYTKKNLLRAKPIHFLTKPRLLLAITYYYANTHTHTTLFGRHYITQSCSPDSSMKEENRSLKDTASDCVRDLDQGKICVSDAWKTPGSVFIYC